MLQTCGVSSVTGAGVSDFFAQVALAAKDYDVYYKVELQKRIDKKQKEKDRRQAESMERLKRDLAPGDKQDASVSQTAKSALRHRS